MHYGNVSRFFNHSCNPNVAIYTVVKNGDNRVYDLAIFAIRPIKPYEELCFDYQTKKTKKGGWDHERRVAAKAEHIDGKENPRFVVTSLSAEQWTAQALYEELYCARGDMENRIKEQFSLFADRVSAETMRANQMRLYLSTMAYILVSGLRRLGLKSTELAQAQVSTIRTKLLKIGAQIRVTVRKVWVSMASTYAWQDRKSPL